MSFRALLTKGNALFLSLIIETASGNTAQHYLYAKLWLSQNGFHSNHQMKTTVED
jgi:hypothetical protein